MGPKRPEKRARKEDSIVGNPIKEHIQRKGVTWRRDTTKFTVEMRPPNWKLKLNFGSYDTEAEAMVARDYGAFLRALAGEKGADAGGFGADNQLYHFEESHAIFESMEETKARRERIRPLYQQLKAQKWSGDGIPPHHEFCKGARKDIAVAIQKFRENYPHRLATSRPTETRKDVPKVEPVDSGIHCTPSTSSSSEVRVSPEPTPECESGAITRDDTSVCANLLVITSVQIAVAVNGSPLQILLDMKVPLLHDEQILQVVRSYIDKIGEELNKSWLEIFLEESGPCPVDPVSIPAIEVPDPKT